MVNRTLSNPEIRLDNFGAKTLITNKHKMRVVGLGEVPFRLINHCVIERCDHEGVHSMIFVIFRALVAPSGNTK